MTKLYLIVATALAGLSLAACDQPADNTATPGGAPGQTDTAPAQPTTPPAQQE